VNGIVRLGTARKKALVETACIGCGGVFLGYFGTDLAIVLPCLPATDCNANQYSLG